MCNINLISLPNEILELISNHLDINNLKEISQVCTLFHAFANDFANRKSIDIYGTEFWERARRRPRHTSKPAKTRLDELVRLESFQREVQRIEGKRFKNSDFFNLWSFLDKKKESKAFIRIHFDFE